MKPLELTHPQFVVLATIGWYTKEGTQKLAAALPAVEKADAHFFASVNLHKIRAIEALQTLAGIE